MEEKFKIFEDITRDYMRKAKIPGVAVSIFQNDKIIYSKGFGARDLEGLLPMTPKTLIGIGSITKSFTAFGIMKLIEKNLISLEDSVSKYLDFAPFTSHPEIQIRHILSHSSGVPAADGGLALLFYTFGDYKRVFPATTKDDFIAHLGKPEDFIIYSPGEKFYYNNDMYICLGFIIEQLSGVKYPDFIKKEILDPLEMNRAVFTKKDFDNDPLNDKMTGYLHQKEGDIVIPKKKPVPLYEYLNAPGGLYVSMEEMMNYANCLLHEGIYKNQKLISSQSIKDLWTPRIISPYGYSKNPQYCLGWVYDEDYFPHTLIHHGGGLGTSCAFFGLIPDLKIGISVAQNCCSGLTSVIGLTALSLLLDLDPNTQVEELRMGQIIDEIGGVYKSSHDLYELKIYLKGTVLYADIETDDGPMGFPLIPNNLNELSFTICSTLPKIKDGIKFIRDDKTKRVSFATFDRYLYKKK